MIRDPILKLALSIHTNPGVYALLLGSGASRSAGIPTGWEIILDLINKIAAVEGEDPQPDPEKWYLEKYGEIPQYDDLLDRLTTTPTERMALLRSYFEPSEKEREEGLKSATDAHRSIAKLVKLGYIRIILTTNFDRLMETALELEGVTPDVISSDDTLKGSLPYVHSNCLVIKLHGDYRDTRIKNTPDELAHYSSGLNDLLDRILDEFGLVICGWSGVWDTALRKAILRARSRRFTAFWLARGTLTDEAQEIVHQRRAEVIDIRSADELFPRLEEKIQSLKELEISHPIAKDVAITTVKRYIAEPRYRIKLFDLINEELERVYARLSSERFETRNKTATKDKYQLRIRQYEAVVEQLIEMLVAISFFDTGENASLLTRGIERLSQPPRHEGSTFYLALQRYPVYLLVYATGIIACAADRYKNAAAILLDPIYTDKLSGEKSPNVLMIRPNIVFDKAQTWVPRPNAENEYTPVNQYMFDVIYSLVEDYLPDPLIYEEFFDIFEYLLSLTFVDITNFEGSQFGRFAWRYRFNWDQSPVEKFIKDGFQKGANWGLLKAGFFKGSLERLEQVRRWYHEYLVKIIKTW